MGTIALGPRALLEAQGLRRTFGGVAAVWDVDLRLEPGEIRGLIGPNGAGKTTLASLITGRVRATAGRVFFRGEEITALPAPRRVRLGIASTFQIPALLRTQTVFENVALAAQRTGLRSPLDFLRFREADVREQVLDALERVGLAGASGSIAGELPYGHQRMVELAMVLALRPLLVVLDEPTQGLTADEIRRLVGLVREIRRTASVILIEHNLPVVLELADRITVLDQGRIAFEGTPAEVEAHPKVQRIYLGTVR